MITEVDVRRRRIGGAIAVVIGIALLALAAFAMTGKLGATTASDGAPPETISAGATSGSATAAASDSASTEQAATKAPLTVLNASGTAGLAGKGKAAFEAGGWQVSEIGNLSGATVPNASSVFYPADDQAAHVAAQNLVKQFPKLVAAEMPSGFAYQGVVVVLVGDWIPGQ